jgi:L-ascorbate 6-phosphate lactonase
MPELGVNWPRGRTLLDQITQETPPRGSLAFWHLGQSGFAVKGGQSILYFDPFLSPSGERLKRMWEPPFAPEEVTEADWVFCSHDHLDHLDPYTVQGIARSARGARFVVPPAALGHMAKLGIDRDRVFPAQVGVTTVDDVRQPRDGTFQDKTITIHAVPAAHGDSATPLAEYVWEADPERGHRFLGYVIECNGVRLYHAGDTIVYPGMVERLSQLSVDIALVPINGRDWFREQRQIIGNMDHREAAALGHAIGADVIVPVHFDMFAGNPGSPGLFAEYCLAQFPGQGFHIPSRCRRWVYVK